MHPKSLVDAVWHCRNTRKAGVVEGHLAKEENPYDATLAWRNIIKFRVVKPYVEPREFWINEYADGLLTAWHTKEVADFIESSSRIRCIHVREVIE